jgi:hypothetical protein
MHAVGLGLTPVSCAQPGVHLLRLQPDVGDHVVWRVGGKHVQQVEALVQLLPGALDGLDELVRVALLHYDLRSPGDNGAAMVTRRTRRAGQGPGAQAMLTENLLSDWKLTPKVFWTRNWIMPILLVSFSLTTRCAHTSFANSHNGPATKGTSDACAASTTKGTGISAPARLLGSRHALALAHRRALNPPFAILPPWTPRQAWIQQPGDLRALGRTQGDICAPASPASCCAPGVVLCGLRYEFSM